MIVIPKEPERNTTFTVVEEPVESYSYGTYFKAATAFLAGAVAVDTVVRKSGSVAGSVYNYFTSSTPVEETTRNVTSPSAVYSSIANNPEAEITIAHQVKHMDLS